MPAKCSLRAPLLLCSVGIALLPGALAAQLSAVHSQLWQEGADGVPGESEQNDKFGWGLAAGDFDGDGFADLAIGVPGEDYAIPPDGFRTDAGSLTVLYGTRDGLASGRAQVWNQGNLLLQGSPENGDEWATTLATGDFDGDGFDDLAIGAPYHDDGAEERTGEIQVLYGSASGLGTSGNQSFTTFFFSAESTSFFNIGLALAAGDFDGDGRDDLAVGAPGAYDQTGSGSHQTGAVLLYYGSDSGLVAPTFSDDYWEPADLAFSWASDRISYFGRALATADFNLDGYDELVVGAPDSACYPITEPLTLCGSVHILRGSAGGLDNTEDYVDRGSSAGGYFGEALATGRFVVTPPPSVPDLAIGIRRADAPGAQDAGGVLVCGCSLTVSCTSCSLWDQDSDGVSSASEAYDYFGEALAAGYFDGAGGEDLAIGVPGEDWATGDADGLVQILSGGASMTAPSGQDWSQFTAGVPGVAEDGDVLGKSLATGDFNGDGRDDLAIGVPQEDIGSDISGANAGAVMVIYALPPGHLFSDDFEVGDTSRWN